MKISKGPCPSRYPSHFLPNQKGEVSIRSFSRLRSQPWQDEGSGFYDGNHILLTANTYILSKIAVVGSGSGFILYSIHQIMGQEKATTLTGPIGIV